MSTDVAPAPERARWPVVAGLAAAAGLAGSVWAGLADSGTMAAVLVAAGFVYLGAAALGNRRAAWPLFALTFVVIGVEYAVPAFQPAWVLLGVAVGVAGWGLARGVARPAWGMPFQAVALAAVAAVAAVVLASDEPWAGILVAAGLLGHAAWDARHHRSGRVVVRSMSQFCGVLDAALAVAILATALVTALVRA